MRSPNERGGIRRLTRNALLTAIALIIFMVEARIPELVPIPGVKLGLANIVTVWAMFTVGPVDTLMILLVRVLLGSVFSGQLMTLFYSLGGGLLCYLTMLLLRRVMTEKQIWLCSAFCAIAHNLGQLGVAVLVLGSPALIAYLPVLLISGVLTGSLTGWAAQLLAGRLPRL